MNMNYIREIAEALSENHAALMVGAGFSKNAEKVSITDKKFLNWNELSDLFYETVYGKEGPGKQYNSSLRLAQEVEITVGRPKLEKIIKDAVPDLEYAPSEVYVKLMEMPWKDVFTTNYDTLLERAADKVTNRRYNVVICQEDLVNSNNAPRILKLHGSFPSYRPFIITEEDYRTYPVKFAAMVNTVQQALLENVFCMLGFSCEDPNFIKWIGWIHDNLGKSSSQKIYMVSVTHIAEAKRKLLFERNIIVIDLQELWPDKNIGDRLNSFLEELKLRVEEKRRKDNWFDLRQLHLQYDTDFVKKTEIMKKLNESYPGWIFLPWKMKNKVSYVLNELDNMNEFEHISFTDQVNYMYEYVKFMDIAGRPILSQVEKEKVYAYFEALSELYKNSIAIDMIEACFVDDSKFYFEDFQNKIWLSNEQELGLIKDFYDVLYINDFKLQNNDMLLKCSNMLFRISIYRVISSEILHNMAALKLCYAIIKNEIVLKTEIQTLLVCLLKLQDETVIKQTDSEQEALYKLRCRIISCKIAKELYVRGIKSDIVDGWKRISENKNEFIEIRNVVFDTTGDE